jgi:hypothetical protein
MSETKPNRPGRRGRSTTEKIAELEQQLRQLREQERKELAQKIERNRKVIFDLFRVERLDTVEVEMWRRHLPKIKALLGLSTAAAGESATAGKSALASEPQGTASA